MYYVDNDTGWDHRLKYRYWIYMNIASKASTMQVASEIFKKEGFRGINKGVNAVAVRQCTNWASRFAIARYAQQMILRARYGDENIKPSAVDKVASSMVAGALSCWNQPIEVIRVEMVLLHLYIAFKY